MKPRGLGFSRTSLQRKTPKASMRHLFFLLLLALIAIISVITMLNMNLSSSKAFHNVFTTQFVRLPEKLPVAKLNLTILVLSHGKNVDKRRAVRYTYGKNLDSFNCALFFVIGVGENKDDFEIQMESKHFGDLIQVNVHESLGNVVEKLQSAYSFLNSQVQTKFVLKTDDDVLINLPVLSAKLKGWNMKYPLLIGHQISQAMPVTDPTNKYFDKNIDQNTVFPAYLSGTGYVINKPALKLLSVCDKALPTISLEDVYFTGYCRKHFNILMVHQKKFGFNKRLAVPCVLKSVITIHGVSPGQMQMMWTDMSDKNLVCE